MKNKLSDLNNHLFAQLERLSEEGLSADEIEQEVKRGAAMTDLADKIIANAALQLRAVGMMAEHGERVGRHLTMLENKS